MKPSTAHHHIRPCLWLAGLLALSPAFAADGVSGVASFQELIRLPPSAVFEARLEDVTGDPAAPALVARTEVAAPASPIRFQIPYAAKAIDPKRRYTVRGSISVDGQLWFATEQPQPVFQRPPAGSAAAATEVRLPLVWVPVPAARQPASAAPAASAAGPGRSASGR